MSARSRECKSLTAKDHPSTLATSHRSACGHAARLVLDGHGPAKDRAVIRQLLGQISRQSRVLAPNRGPVIFELAEPPSIPPPFLWSAPEEGTQLRLFPATRREFWGSQLHGCTGMNR